MDFSHYGIENIVVKQFQRTFHVAGPPKLKAVAM